MCLYNKQERAQNTQLLRIFNTQVNYAYNLCHANDTVFNGTVRVIWDNEFVSMKKR